MHRCAMPGGQNCLTAAATYGAGGAAPGSAPQAPQGRPPLLVEVFDGGDVRAQLVRHRRGAGDVARAVASSGFGVGRRRGRGVEQGGRGSACRGEGGPPRHRPARARVWRPAPHGLDHGLPIRHLLPPVARAVHAEHLELFVAARRVSVDCEGAQQLGVGEAALCGGRLDLAVEDLCLREEPAAPLGNQLREGGLRLPAEGALRGADELRARAEDRLGVLARVGAEVADGGEPGEQHPSDEHSDARRRARLRPLWRRIGRRYGPPQPGRARGGGQRRLQGSGGRDGRRRWRRWVGRRRRARRQRWRRRRGCGGRPRWQRGGRRLERRGLRRRLRRPLRRHRRRPRRRGQRGRLWVRVIARVYGRRSGRRPCAAIGVLQLAERGGGGRRRRRVARTGG
mmetsp:Transcript_41450/g.133903  ORF Transcript_41450/g.133903 Transcript_41450/m.133903 type:complete len:397 (+) Transcript_41450:203-1393(+)